MARQFSEDDEYSKPRKNRQQKGRKKERRDDLTESQRRNKVNFKRYLRDLEEQELLNFDEEE